MKNSLVLALLVAVGAPGCYLDLSGDPTPPTRPGPGTSALPDGGIDAAEWDGGGWDGGPWNVDAPVWDEPRENSLAVDAIMLNGRLGEVSSNGAGESYVFESFSATDLAIIDIRSRNEFGVLMNQLTIANSQLLELGESYQSDATTDGASVFVSVVGCSGPDDGQWRTDTGSEEVTLDVREGPEEGSAELFYSASFRNGDTVEGSFVLPLTQ